MKQAIIALGIAGIIASSPVFSGEDQLCKLVKNNPTAATFQDRYIFMSNGGATYNEMHKIGNDNLIIQYPLSPGAVPIPGGAIIPGTRKPSSYVFRGKAYVDPKMDGINCNEEPYRDPSNTEG